MGTCRACGKDGTQLCSRCKGITYCSVECQRSDWKRHKKAECTSAELLPKNFVAEDHLRCLLCIEQPWHRGQCPGAEHAAFKFFIMPKVPAHFTVKMRIRRWAMLMDKHPVYNGFDALRFVDDFSPLFIEDLIETKPIIAQLMEEYKNGDESSKGIRYHCRLLAEKQPISIPFEAFVEESQKDCDFAMEHFFAGNWGYLTLGDLTYLNNAINGCGPEDLEGEMVHRFERVFTAVKVMLDAFALFGQKHFGYRLEDEYNPFGS